jgi:LmbE family N-acetylglucosaminyl deacetylase
MRTNRNSVGGWAMAMLVLAAGLSLAAAQHLQAQTSNKSILAIFAHPDDDIMIGPLLPHYAKAGVQVQLVIVTSGQQGVTPHAKIPAGAQLGAIREAESRAACKAYGINEPILLGEQDGTLGTMKRHDEIVARLDEIVHNLKPSVIITFGPDGITGHTDHRAVSNMVTEVFQTFPANHPAGPIPGKLYYVTYPASLFSTAAAASLPGRVATMSDSYVTTVVESKDGLAAAARAEECYVSQHTPETMATLNQAMANVLKGNIYLRLALSRPDAATNSEKDVFARLP